MSVVSDECGLAAAEVIAEIYYEGGISMPCNCENDETTDINVEILDATGAYYKGILYAGAFFIFKFCF